MLQQNESPCQYPAALPSYVARRIILVDPERLTFKVESASRPGEFHTVEYRQDWCSCPDHIFRGRRCVHLLDVDAWIGEREAALRAILVCGACGETASRLFDGVCGGCSLAGRRAS